RHPASTPAGPAGVPGCPSGESGRIETGYTLVEASSGLSRPDEHPIDRCGGVEDVTMAMMPARGRVPRRVAMVSVHTSPLDQPGTGDAGGMNVFVVEVSRRLAEMGVAVDVFTRATSSSLPPEV